MMNNVDDISHLIDQSDYKLSVKLLLVKNDKEHKVFNDIELKFGKELHELGNEFYLIRLTKERVRIGKKLR
jgi:hypothetical protein